MIPCKISYFLTHALLGSYMPYCNVFLTSVGLTPTQAGFITGLRTIVSFVCGPMWGAIADHTGRRKLVYMILCFGTMSLLFPLPWIARYVTDWTFIEGKENIIQDWRNESYGNSTLLKNATSEKFVTRNLFLAMMMTFFASAAFDTPLMGYQDSIVIDVVKCSKRKTMFGYQRVFGSIGFGIATFVAGLAADNYHHSSLSSYTAIFFVFLPAGLLMIPFGVILHKQGNDARISVESQRDKRVLKLLLKTCLKPSNTFFLSTVFVMGLANGINYGFTFLFMDDYMTVTKSIMGLSIVCSCGFEILVFPTSNKLIRLLGGTMSCIIVGLFVTFIRFLSISFVENPWLVLPISSLNCLTFALPWAAMLGHTQLISPVEIRTTMFSVLTGIHFPLGTLVGNMVGGPLYEKYGGRTFFRASSLIFVCWGVLMILYFHVSKYYCLKKENDSENVQEKDFENAQKSDSEHAQIENLQEGDKTKETEMLMICK